MVIEREWEANRPDALSMAGVARDLAAYFGVPFALPDPRVATSGTDAAELAYWFGHKPACTIVRQGRIHGVQP